MRGSPALLALLLAVLPAVARPAGPEEEAPDLAGVWHSGENDLVLRRVGEGSWMGHPAERGAGQSWHLQALGEGRYQFWIMVEGGFTTQKLDDQRVTIPAGADRFPLRLSDRRGEREVEWTRILAPVPARIGEVQVLFAPGARGRPAANQDVDLRLARAFRRGVVTAREADPGLTRVSVAGTIDFHAGASRLHSRLVRCALDVDAVNGTEAGHWAEDVQAKLEALAAGERPETDPRRDHAHHVTALVLALLIEEDLAEVVCPEVLDEDTVPYLEWWLGRHAASLPERAPSIVGYRKLFAEMLERTESLRRKVKGWLHVAVEPREGGLPLGRKALDERNDRE